jgi:hypothetical protein
MPDSMLPPTVLNRLKNTIGRYEKPLCAALLCVIVFVLWSIKYRMGRAAWKMPMGYGGDGWLILGTARAYMNGEVFPFFSKLVPTLNAPFAADWNDYPVTEDLLYAAMGWLGKVIGLYAAGNAMLLLAHILAALSFWWVALKLDCKPVLAMAGALAYAFCNYIMARRFGHLPLTWFWHLPLLILVTGWVYSDTGVPRSSQRFWPAIAICLICGALNPYYTGMFLQFLGFGVLLHAARRSYSRMLFALMLIAVTFGAFMLMNLDTIVHAVLHGANAQAAARDLAALDMYAMKIPEMLLPPDESVLPGLEEFSQSHYYSKTLLKGEFWSPYLGLAALLGVAMLVCSSLYRMFTRRANTVSPWFWLVIWILLYSLVGGFNLVLGSFGFVLFRGANRYSIFILTFGLLFLVTTLSRHSLRPRTAAAGALLVLLLGLVETLGPIALDTVPPPAPGPTVEDYVNSDRTFAMSVEKQVPGAMVFQLPVAGFPEVAPIQKMGDYEHFRPYLYTRTLHYSYGTDKGRGTEAWQTDVSRLEPAQMVAKLESYGFAVVMVNRRGYADRGASLIAALVAAGKPVIAENHDLVALRLQAAAKPALIDPWAFFGEGWSGDEGTHRWAESGHTKISINNPGTKPLNYTLSLRLSALEPRVVKVSKDTTLLGEALAVPGKETPLDGLRFVLQPGLNVISLDTDAPAVSPGNGDLRLLSFRLSGFKFEKVE